MILTLQALFLIYGLYYTVSGIILIKVIKFIPDLVYY